MVDDNSSNAKALKKDYSDTNQSVGVTDPENTTILDTSNPPILITESMVMDYVTLRGLENKLGLKIEDVSEYILNELLANGLDYIETTLSRGLAPEINVYVTTDDKAIHLKVSNPDTSQTFTTEIIKDMFNYYNYSSTKRNQFKIGRGALGHGLKTVLGAAYALATEHYNHSNWTPIKIRNGNKEFTVALTVDKTTGLQPPDIKSVTIKHIPNTEVEIDIPANEDSVKELKSCFYKYLILNPHITMNITVDGNCEKYPQVQKIKSDWKNLHSIWSYSKKDFEYLVSTIRYEGSLYGAILSIGMKEAYSLIKRSEFNTPLNEAKYDKSLIHKLYDDLRDKSKPTEKLDLPYDMRVKPRKDAIKKRLEQLGIVVSDIKYNSVNELYESKDGEVKFPIFFESAEIKTNQRTKMVSGVNSSVTDLIEIEDTNALKYTKQITYQTDSISKLLFFECGYYINDPKKSKKPKTHIFMNLVSPRIDYESYAKSKINLKPFGKIIGQTVYDTCKGGKRAGRTKGKKTQAEIRLDFLTDRYNAVKQNPQLIIDDRLTPSDVWYGCRPILLDNKIVISKDTRSNFTAAIRKDCEREFDCNMEEIGIFAADRAQLYFNGRWYDVGFDELHSLKFKGTDLIIIEKEGMAETLTPTADRLGWALLFTRGFATKYVRDLSELSKDHGCNVSVLSDYDDSGILLASKLNVPRIGIDPETIEYFDLDREDVEEEYNPKNYLDGILDLVSLEEFRYLSHKRIEINSVKTKVGTEAFQDWVIYKIQELFPSRDYTRSIKIETVLPDELREQFDNITAIVGHYQENKSNEVTEGLTDVIGFLNVPEKRIEIATELMKVVTDITDYQDFMNKYNELIKHPFIIKALAGENKKNEPG